MSNSSMFRFSIRELLLFTVIAAVLVAWWLDHRNAQNEARLMQEGWNATKKELLATEQQAAYNKKVVSALRRVGLSDVGHKDGTVTVQKSQDIGGDGFSR